MTKPLTFLAARIVDRLHRGAVAHRRHDRLAVQHAGHHGIDAVLGRAVGLGRDVELRHRLADQRVLAGRLELDRLQLVGGPHLARLAVGDDLGVAHLLAGLAVDDLAVAGAAFAGRHAHHRSTRLDQRDAPGGARPAHRVEVHAHAPRAAGDQRPQHGIVVLRDRCRRSWMFIMRQSASSSSATICAMARRHVLAHLGLADHHGDLAVRRDRVPGGRAELAGRQRVADACRPIPRHSRRPGRRRWSRSGNSAA